MSKIKQVDPKAVKVVVAALQDLISKGVQVTDSEMFKYTSAYTGDSWKDNRNETRKAA